MLRGEVDEEMELADERVVVVSHAVEPTAGHARSETVASMTLANNTLAWVMVRLPEKYTLVPRERAHGYNNSE
jgi:hypothetical protein